MRIFFYLRFFTRPGEEMRLAGSIPELGLGRFEGSVAMSYLNDQYWKLELELPSKSSSARQFIRYRYIFSPIAQPAIEEREDERCIQIPSNKDVNTLYVIDTWHHEGDIENVFFTSPFRNVLLPTNISDDPPTNSILTHCFRVKAPLLRSEECLCLVGADQALGGWDTTKMIPMHRNRDWWEVIVDMSQVDLPSTYKYAVFDRSNNCFVRYEQGSNRTLEKWGGRNDYCILHDGFARLATTSFRATGVAIPVFSLRSRKSFGVGQFTDVPMLVDWAKQVGLKMIQLLPVNDTTAKGTWEDSYPYSAISVFALHPIYLDIETVVGDTHKHLLQPWDDQKSCLQALEVLDYEAVMRTKMSMLDILFPILFEKTFSSKRYQEFFQKNCDWLIPYAAFCTLRDRFGTPDTSKWKIHTKYNKTAITKYCNPDRPHFEQIAKYYFIQYHLHVQLQTAHLYANSNGIILKGDIPIGVSRYGVETWMEPDFFYLNQQAGAPPDDFAIKGQNWGFPTYHWRKIKADGFRWWKKRFIHMAHYFDAFRIDHILGFFRIWSIPYEQLEGIMGRFVPAIPIRLDELNEKGIFFEPSRLCQPWIDDAVLWELFGTFQEQIKPFLEKKPEGGYQLKESCNTQRKVLQLCSSKLDLPERGRIQQALFDLISNIILIEEPGSCGSQFHFRFKIDDTLSYKYLPASAQKSLKELYIDYFFCRQDALWYREAMDKLPALKRCTDMLICGEDLGLVPGCVPDVLKQLGIHSMEIQRMPKDSRSEFFHPADAPYLSVVTPSSHDMSTIREWWEEDDQRTQRFFTYELGQSSLSPKKCEPWICEQILSQHMLSPAQWAIFQLQDLLSIDGLLRRPDPKEERINVPSDSHHYWGYRMHLTLEELYETVSFNHRLKSLIVAAGRTL
ncbi:MAG: 4-alpha-glucanotransferase [Bacteroidetes bacterium]|nr:4-alpha-glucanotransferase [Bacteroidota bacterium]